MLEIENKSASALSDQKAFSGRYHHVLDERKRLTVPADWRAMVGDPERLFIWKSAHGAFLQVLPLRIATQRMGKLAEASLMDKPLQDKNRILAGRMDVVPWDAQGRVKLRDDMLVHAGINEKVCLIGVIGCFEIWSEELVAVEKQMEPTHEQILAALQGTGL
jgi:MraZ protein